MGIPLVRVVPASDGAVTVSVAAIDDYILRWARNPDRGSWFDILTFWRHAVPDQMLLYLLRWMGYGAQLHIQGGDVINHIFHQRHGDALHVFSIVTNEDHTGQGIAKRMLREWLLEAYKSSDVRRVRISAGRDEVVAHMYEQILAGKYDLPFPVTRGSGPGWINFVR